MQRPSVGRVVHYVARGSADGAFPSVCRAAMITDVRVAAFSARDDPVYIVSLAVLNPTGLFFQEHTEYNEFAAPGTWHWPERVE